MKRVLTLALIFTIAILSVFTQNNEASAATIKVMWGKTELKSGQIGKITVNKPINLWKRDANENLSFVRVLKPGEEYRVYRYDAKHGGQYGLGGGMWITKMPTHVKYETPSKAKLAELKAKEQLISQMRNKYIGLHVDPLPAGAEYMGGSLITEDDDYEEYAIEYVRDSGYMVVLFQEMTHRNYQGKAFWKILDATVVDDLKRGYTTCSGVYKNGKYVAPVFAVAKYTGFENKEYLPNVEYAFFANKQMEKFEAVSTSGMSCYNEGYGL